MAKLVFFSLEFGMNFNLSFISLLLALQKVINKPEDVDWAFGVFDDEEDDEELDDVDEDEDSDDAYVGDG